MVLNPGNLPGGMFEWRVPVCGDNAVYEQKDKKKILWGCPRDRPLGLQDIWREFGERN